MPAPATSAQQREIQAAIAARESSRSADTGRSNSAAPSGGGGSPAGRTSTPAGNTQTVTQQSTQRPSVVQSIQTKLGTTRTNMATQQARLNMMKDPTNPNLPGMHGPGGFAGTQPGASPREQGAATSMLAKDMTDRYGMDPAAARDFVAKAARTISGEAANQGDLGRAVVAKTMLNRMDLGSTMPKPDNQYSTDPNKVLSAYDANGMRPGTVENAMFQKSIEGTPQYGEGLAALNAAVTPGAISPALSKFTHYRTQEMGPPSWENGPTFNVGDHVFSNPDISRTRVAAAQNTVEGREVPDVTAGFQNASFVPGAIGINPGKVYTDRVPQVGDTTNKVFSDRVPGATAEPATYTPGMPELPEPIPDAFPSVSRPNVRTYSGYGPNSTPATSVVPTSAPPSPKMTPAFDPRMSPDVYDNPEDIGNWDVLSGIRAPAPGTISPMAGQGNSWPVQGQESMWGTYESPQSTLDTIDEYTKHWYKPDSSTQPEETVEKTLPQKIENPFKAAGDGATPTLEKVNKIFGGSDYSGIYGRPDLSSTYDRRGRDSERIPARRSGGNQFAMNKDLATLLRRYFSGR